MDAKPCEEAVVCKAFLDLEQQVLLGDVGGPSPASRQ